MKTFKQIIFLIAALAFIATISNAQNTVSDTRDQVQFGLKLGGNLSNVYDTNDESFKADSKLGLAGGVFAAIPIGTFLGVQPEFLFSQKGFKGSGSVLGSEYKYSRTSNFIDVPLLLAIKPISFLTILVGPQYSFLLKETYKFENAIINIDEDQVFDNDNIRKNTLCFTGGFDFNYDQFVLGARLGWDLQNNKGDGTSTTPRYKNMWYQATLGFRFSSN